MSEIMVLGIPSILIPSPYVPNNHQYKNAKVLCDKQAAFMIEEKDLTGENLTELVKKLSENKDLRLKTENNVREFAVTDTLDRICKIIDEILKNGRK